MAFTTNIWTSFGNDAYLSLTIHSIDNSWSIVLIAMATAPFPVCHIAANNVSKVKQVIMEDFYLEVDCLLTPVHDPCSNMQLAGKILLMRSLKTV